MQEVISFYKEWDVPTRQILDSKGAIPSMKADDAKKAIQDMADHSKKWHNGTSTRTRSTKTSDGLAAIHAQLNNIGRKIKKKENTRKAITRTFGVPFPQGGQYRAAAPGFYQRNNANPSYQEQRQTMEESLSKFMAESTKIHEENSNFIKEISTSTDATIRNQEPQHALESHIGHMSKVTAKKGNWKFLPWTMKHPKGIAENVLVGIDNFIFPIDFIILDMPEDIKTLLILERPFLSTAHAKIDVFKKKIALRFKRKMELGIGTRLIGETSILDRSQDPEFGDLLELNDLNEPLELRMESS
ncbi:ribonuclease H-like domain-containing protein [Tanacetum coccineum]